MRTVNTLEKITTLADDWVKEGFVESNSDGRVAFTAGYLTCLEKDNSKSLTILLEAQVESLDNMLRNAFDATMAWGVIGNIKAEEIIDLAAALNRTELVEQFKKDMK